MFGRIKQLLNIGLLCIVGTHNQANFIDCKNFTFSALFTVEFVPPKILSQKAVNPFHIMLSGFLSLSYHNSVQSTHKVL